MSRLKYQVLAEELRRGIRAGSWVRGEQLPTQDEMAARHQISVTSVRRAIDALVDEGLVERRQGAGTFVLAPRVVRRMSGEIGVLVPDAQLYFPRILAGVEAALAEYGLGLRVATYDNDVRREATALNSLDGVDGLLVAPWFGDPATRDEAWRGVSGLGVPAVLLERRGDWLGHADRLDHVCTDHAGGAVDAVDHLWELGHRRIGLLVRDQPMTIPLVMAGYDWAMRRLGGAVRSWKRDMGEWRGQAPSVLREVLDAGCTAVLVAGDQEAIHMQRAARQIGIHIPDDLAMVSYDDELADRAPVPLTAVAPPKFRLGRTAVQVLWRRLLEGESAETLQVSVRPTLVRRESS